MTRGYNGAGSIGYLHDPIKIIDLAIVSRISLAGAFVLMFCRAAVAQTSSPPVNPLEALFNFDSRSAPAPEKDVSQSEVEFWRRLYNIPKYYNVCGVTFESEDPKQTFAEISRELEVLGATSEHTTESKQRGHRIKTGSWRLSSEKVNEAGDVLQKIDGLRRFKRKDFLSELRKRGAADPQELYVKRRLLKEAWSRLKQVQDKYPAAAGLTAAQRDDLADLIQKHEAAVNESRISVIVDDSSVPGSHVKLVLVPEFPEESQTGNSGESVYWKRNLYDSPCGALKQETLVETGVADEGDADELENSLQSLAEPIIMERCVPSARLIWPGGLRSWLRDVVIWTSEKNVQRIKDLLADRNTVIRWAHRPIKNPIDSSVQEKVRLLEKDLRSGEQLFESLPDIRDLVRSEINRLRPLLQTYQATNGKVNMRISLYLTNSEE